MDRPIILDSTLANTQARLKHLRQSGVELQDEYESQCLELRAITGRQKTFKSGNWVYFPWAKRAIHILAQRDYYQLRTLRNYPLISHQTQRRLQNLDIAIAGLSVGSNIVRSLVYAGIGRQIRLADDDTLATSNLNRITGNLLNVGQKKASILARQLWEIDPYLDLVIYVEGVQGHNLVDFLGGKHKPLILFDEVDDLGLKVHLRLAARAANIIYMMVTDNGHSAELDVVRFDQSSNEGGMKGVPLVSLESIASGLQHSEKVVLTAQQEQALINTLIDSSHRAPEMKLAAKLKLAGKIGGWPQLQAIAGVGASMAVYALRDYVEDKLRSGKKVISLS